MPNCAVIWCNNQSKNVNKQNSGVTYHMFPRDPNIKDKWILATGKCNWFPQKHDAVCSQHFEAECFMRMPNYTRLFFDAIPTLKLHPICNEMISIKMKHDTHNTTYESSAKRRKFYSIEDNISTMPSSDSEDFESADEGNSNVDKKERKKRLSSSNYSDSQPETNQCFSKTPTKVSITEQSVAKKDIDGWNDFEVDETETIDAKVLPTETVSNTKKDEIPSCKNENVNIATKSKDTGWDDFEDWSDSELGNIEKEPPKVTSQNQKCQPEPNIKEVTDKMAAASTGSGWGWGWSVDSLLSTATAGITNITNHVSQGISTVLETGIGAPDPEELARQSHKTAKDAEPKDSNPEETVEKKLETPISEELKGSSGDAAFPFGNLLSGVTKFVESTGTKVLAGGLDTLETIGKKTMEVLQDGDPGLAKKRAMLGLDSGDKPILSQVLREAKEKADEEDKVKDERREAKEVHYETLFDDFEGLVHLEALEMLSRQVSMRIDERLRAATPEKKQDIKETLQQVSELCEMPEDDDDDVEDSSQDNDKANAFYEKLQIATQDLGLKLQFQPLINQYREILEWLATTTEQTDKAVYKRCVSALAQTTALSVQIYHKAGELLLTKPRRSTADEADALTQMTVVLTKHISELATCFTEKLNTIPSDYKEQINTYITNIFLEAGNSSTYIQNAFQLALPILQIGAV